MVTRNRQFLEFTRPLSKEALTKNITNKKIDIDELPFATIRLTVTALKWVFLLVFLYLIVSILILLWQGGTDSLTQILVYSITGFFTFFMGYFGWEFARSVMGIIGGHSALKEDEL